MPEGLVQFDREQLVQMVNEIGDYLAELYYIEHVIRLREEVDFSRWYLVGFMTAHRPTNKIVVELGIPEYRFNIEMRVLPAEEEAIRSQIESYQETAREKARGQIDFFRQSIGPLLHPKTSGFELIERRLNTVLSLHRITTEDDFGEISDLSSEWHGLAARDFFREFYNPFAKVREVQSDLIEALIGGFAIAKGIMRFSQNSLMNAVTNTHEALREQLQWHSSGDHGASAKKRVLMVSSSAASILSAAGRGNLLWAIGSEGIAQVLGFVAAELPNDAEETSIEGQAADEILHGLVQAKTSIDEYVSNQHDHLKGQLAGVREEVDALRHRLYPGRPYLADSPVRGPADGENNPDEFYFRGPEE